ncbi:MAG: response regulator, partial [Planctomycetota bacterium]|nr:response regulator [Planctomycetota bacterium]
MSRILVVDDKEMMRDSVATLLGRRGHGVVAASGGEQALEKLGARRPDVVVTDLQMPGMNGLELLAAIQEVDDGIPVIFMTAY